MKLVTFTQGGTTRIGAVEAEEVVDFSAQCGDLPRDMLTFLEQGQAVLAISKRRDSQCRQYP